MNVKEIESDQVLKFNTIKKKLKTQMALTITTSIGLILYLFFSIYGGSINRIESDFFYFHNIILLLFSCLYSLYFDLKNMVWMCRAGKIVEQGGKVPGRKEKPFKFKITLCGIIVIADCIIGIWSVNACGYKTGYFILIMWVMIFAFVCFLTMIRSISERSRLGRKSNVVFLMLMTSGVTMIIGVIVVIYIVFIITTGKYFKNVNCDKHDMITLENFDNTDKIELRKRNEDKFILSMCTYDIIGENRCRADVYYSKYERIIERLINDAKTDKDIYGGFEYEFKNAKKIDNEKYTIYQVLNEYGRYQYLIYNKNNIVLIELRKK